jgi:hypothetical protein
MGSGKWDQCSFSFTQINRFWFSGSAVENCLSPVPVGKRGSVFIFFHTNKPILVFRFSSGKLSVPGPCLVSVIGVELRRRELHGPSGPHPSKTRSSAIVPQPFTSEQTSPNGIRPVLTPRKGRFTESLRQHGGKTVPKTPAPSKDTRARPE